MASLRAAAAAETVDATVGGDDSQVGVQGGDNSDSKGQTSEKMSLRLANLHPQRPDAAFLRTLDSSIKRNTALVKRLKQITEDQREALLEELQAVNLSKFTSEAVTAICDAKLKISDVNAAVQVCSALHQRYKDFGSNLVTALAKTVTSSSKGSEDTDTSSRLAKRRTSFRLLTELYFSGVFDDFGILLGTLRELMSTEQLKDHDVTQANLALVVSFAKQTKDLFAGSGDIQQQDAGAIKITPDQKKTLLKSLTAYYDTVVKMLHNDHQVLMEQEKGNARTLGTKGELNEETASAYEKARKLHDQLFRNVSLFAECLDKEPPAMAGDDRTVRVTATDESGALQKGAKTNAGAEALWDDEETRLFYESLPDLRAFVPAVLLGEPDLPKGDQQQKGSSGEDGTDTGGDSPVALETSSASGAGPSAAEDGGDVGGTSVESARAETTGSKKESEETEKGQQRQRVGEATTGLDRVVQRLPSCVSCALIDQLTVEFCYLNSKTNRKKLVRALFNVPRTSLELIPYYSRLAATLSTCMRDVGPSLIALLEEEFNHLFHKKDQINVEVKIRNIRFLGELTKFKLGPPSLIFSLLKMCLEDFTHHNVDVVCNLLETCGRFLYRLPETRVRMGNMLDIMMRLKAHRNFDSRHATLIDNAYFHCKPPERAARVVKVLPPLHQYLKKLFQDMEKSNIEHVLRQLRRLPWSDSECKAFVLKCFAKVHRCKHSQVHLMASLTAGLSRYHEDVAVAVVDELLESVRQKLEATSLWQQEQRRLVQMRFLGELYNYRMIDSSVVFDTLYLILFFGHGTPEAEVLDPPEDCFRMRMVIALLQTCGHFFTRGSSKRRLDRFLLYFQRYTLAKSSIPLDIEFDLQDLYAELRTSLARFSSYEEAHQAVLELEAQEEAAAAARRGSEGGTTTAKGGTAAAAGAAKASGGAAAAAVAANAAAATASGSSGVLGGPLLTQESYGDESDSDASGSLESGQGVADDDEELEDETGGEGEGEGEEGGSGDGEDESGMDSAGVADADDDDDDHVKVKHKEGGGGVTAEEDAEFERELRAMMLQESVEARKLLDARHVRTMSLNMAIPMNLATASTTTAGELGTGGRSHGGAREASSGETAASEAQQQASLEGRVAFRVLVKKGGKQQTKQLQIPTECALVQSTKQKEAEELQEKQDIKRRVLEYNSREEEERGPGGGGGGLLMGTTGGYHHHRHSHNSPRPRTPTTASGSGGFTPTATGLPDAGASLGLSGGRIVVLNTANNNSNNSDSRRKRPVAVGHNSHNNSHHRR